jgi:hypothetical protein
MVAKLQSILLFSSLLCGATAAAKQRGPEARQHRFAIREVRIDGQISDADRKALSTSIANAVALHAAFHGTMIEDSLVEKLFDERPYLRECFERACHLEVGDRLGADRLIFVRVERKPSSSARADWELRFMSFGVDALRVVDTQTMPCNACTVSEVVNDSSNTLKAFFNNDPPTPLCKLKVSSRPPDGEVILDGSKVGSTPFEHSVAAGRHSIVLQKEGFAKGETEIECAPGHGQDMTFTLSTDRSTAISTIIAPTSRAEPVDRRPLFRVLGGISLGLAVAGAIIAVTSGALHNQQEDCIDGRCLTHRNGIPGIAAGTVAFGVFGAVGITLLVKSRRPSPPAITLGPAALGLTF